MASFTFRSARSHLGMQKCLFRGITTLPSSITLEVPRPLRSRRCPLQRLFSAFPNGFPGGGLLLLRFVVALNAAAEGIFVLVLPDHETASCWCLGGLAVVTGRFDPDGISYADLLRIGRRRKRDHKPGTVTIEPNANSCKLHRPSKPCDHLCGACAAWSWCIFTRRASFWSSRNHHSRL